MPAKPPGLAVDLEQQSKQLRHYSWVSLCLHVGLFLVGAIGSFFAPKPLLFQNAVQIDMVALPDQVKSQNESPVDVSLPVKDQPPPEKAEEPKAEPEEMAKPESKPEPKPKPDPEAVALKREQEAKKRAEDALKKMRDQAKREAEAEKKKRQEALEKRKADLQRFEQAYRSAIRGNQVNQGNAASGALEATMNAYAGHITSRLQSRWTLPPFLQSQGYRAVVRLYIDARGNVTKMVFKSPSGNSHFDNQVESTIKQATPFAPPPEEMAPGLRSSGLEVLFPL